MYSPGNVIFSSDLRVGLAFVGNVGNQNVNLSVTRTFN